MEIGNYFLNYESHLCKIIDIGDMVYYSKCKSAGGGIELLGITFKKFNVKKLYTIIKSAKKSFFINDNHTIAIKLYTYDEIKDTYLRDSTIIDGYKTSLFKNKYLMRKYNRFINVLEGYCKFNRSNMGIHSNESAYAIQFNECRFKHKLLELNQIIYTNPTINDTLMEFITQHLPENEHKKENVEHELRIQMIRYNHFLNTKDNIIDKKEPNKEVIAECPVCYDHTTCIEFFTCTHSVCNNCFNKFTNKTCMLCRSRSK
jgi:hypothetical protein